MTPMATEGTRNNKDEGFVPVLSDSIPLCSFSPVFCDMMAKSFEGETFVTTHVTPETFSTTHW